MGLRKFQVTVTSVRKQLRNQRRIRQIQPTETRYFAGGELSPTKILLAANASMPIISRESVVKVNFQRHQTRTIHVLDFRNLLKITTKIS